MYRISQRNIAMLFLLAIVVITLAPSVTFACSCITPAEYHMDIDDLGILDRQISNIWVWFSIFLLAWIVSYLAILRQHALLNEGKFLYGFLTPLFGAVLTVLQLFTSAKLAYALAPLFTDMFAQIWGGISSIEIFYPTFFILGSLIHIILICIAHYCFIPRFASNREVWQRLIRATSAWTFVFLIIVGFSAIYLFVYAASPQFGLGLECNCPNLGPAPALASYNPLFYKSLVGAWVSILAMIGWVITVRRML